MQLGAFDNWPVPAAAVAAGIASIGYLLYRYRKGHKTFTLFNGVTLVLLMAIVTAAAVPLLDAAGKGSKETSLLENLYTLRSQIALYKLEHNGEPPILFEGAFPQLVQSTDASGIPGIHSSQRPFGPYLYGGIPANPVTGQVVVTATAVYPPIAASGNGGWLYDQQSGQIAIDLPNMLNR